MKSALAVLIPYMLEYLMGGRRKAPGRVITRSAPTKADPKRKRYTAYYWHGDREVSAGNFDTYEEAEGAWLMQADEIRRGTWVDPTRPKMLFADFVELYRMTRIIDRASSAISQDQTISNHLLPTFGDFQLREIDTQAIQAWVRSLAPTHAGNTRKKYLGQLSGILTAAIEWDYIAKHPCPGVRPPKADASIAQVIDRTDFDTLISVLPGPVSQSFVWVDLNSGLRFGELTELRVFDVHNVDEDLPEEQWPEEQMLYLHVQRTVADVGPEYGDGGGRFKVEDTTKGGDDRKVALDAATSEKLLQHIELHDLKGDDLLFPLCLFIAELETPPPALDPVPVDLGRTEPDKQGRTYAHGTASAYGAGRCRCLWCRRAVAQYRAARRAQGLDRKATIETKKGRNLSDHLPRDTFRNRFWLPAFKTAGLRRIRFHDLRHSHATWLARNGVDVLELQERMGHRRLRTTENYIKKNRKPSLGAAYLMGDLMTKEAARRSLRRIAS